jgi:sugar lactone lactonase YvrE
MTDVTCVLDCKAELGEGPLWDVAEQRLYWVNIKQNEIHRFDPATGRDEMWKAPENVGSLALREKGGLVVALQSGFFFFDSQTGNSGPGKFDSIVKPELERKGNRFNDGKPDKSGRFWAGSMDDAEKQPTGGLYRLGSDLSCKRMVDGIICSNSLCWSADDKTMYYADSNTRSVWAFDYDAASGEIANRRVFIRLGDEAGFPDGATVDAEDFIWVAYWQGWNVTRFDPKGKIERVVKLPVEKPTCPAFGGPNLDICYVTSAWIGGPRQEHSGSIFAFQPGVKGLAEARFKG